MPSPVEYLFCSTCQGQTLHSVNRSGSGAILAQVCRDPGHQVRLAAQDIVLAMGRGSSVKAPEIRAHTELSRFGTTVIELAVALLEADGEIIVVGETGEAPNPFSFSELVRAA